MTEESQFQAKVITLATRLGYDFIYHTHNSRRSPKGFPDLIMIRPRDMRLVVIEFKIKPHKPTTEQQKWLDAFALVTNFCFLWYPEDWDEILEVL